MADGTGRPDPVVVPSTGGDITIRQFQPRDAAQVHAMLVEGLVYGPESPHNTAQQRNLTSRVSRVAYLGFALGIACLWRDTLALIIGAALCLGAVTVFLHMRHSISDRHGSGHPWRVAGTGDCGYGYGCDSVNPCQPARPVAGPWDFFALFLACTRLQKPMLVVPEVFTTRLVTGYGGVTGTRRPAPNRRVPAPAPTGRVKWRVRVRVEQTLPAGHPCRSLHSIRKVFTGFCATARETDMADIPTTYDVPLSVDGVNSPTAQGPGAFWVAAIESPADKTSEVVGYLGLDYRALADPSSGELRRMIVPMNHRRRRIGSLLITAALDHARRHAPPYERLDLETTEFQPGARKLDENHGFSLVGTRIVRMGPLFSMTVLRLRRKMRD
ncbi:hypothetical protein DFH06DRAFT_1089716 [Mycena polygramma]|nr:hypothetical protein DFH06DRAFT_1089716 [Mycena polygramma]